MSSKVRMLKRTIVYEISLCLKDDWKLLINNAIETKVTRSKMNKMVKNCAIMTCKLNLIEVTHPIVYKMLYEFWYPLRFNIGSFMDMKEEADLRMGNPHITEYYYDADKMSVEEAKQKAEEQHGEYRGILTFKRHVIYGLKRTAEQIRSKYEEIEG